MILHVQKISIAMSNANSLQKREMTMWL